MSYLDAADTTFLATLYAPAPAELGAVRPAGERAPSFAPVPVPAAGGFLRGAAVELYVPAPAPAELAAAVAAGERAPSAAPRPGGSYLGGTVTTLYTNAPAPLDAAAVAAGERAPSAAPRPGGSYLGGTVTTLYTNAPAPLDAAAVAAGERAPSAAPRPGGSYLGGTDTNFLAALYANAPTGTTPAEPPPAGERMASPALRYGEARMSFLDGLFTGGGGGPARELATTGAPVNVSNAPPPMAGAVLTALDTTHARWLVAAVVSGGGADTPLNKNMPARTTTADYQRACDIAILSTPAAGSYVGVRVNGVDETRIGNGSRFGVACYFSHDGGATAREWGAITLGDSLYWVASVAGYHLSALSDVIEFVYESAA